MGKEYLKKEPDKTNQYLDRCAGNAREALTDTRRALRALGGMGSGETGSAADRSSSGTGSVTDGTNNSAGGKNSCVMEGGTVDMESSIAGTNGATDRAGNDIADEMESIIDMIEEFSKNTGIEINYTLPDTELAPQENTVLYRVIQEAITNAARHGRATRIDIEAGRDDDGIWFCIQNNGAAGGSYTEGFGLSSMRKRLEDMDGSLEIETGQGFRLAGRFRKTGGYK